MNRSEWLKDQIRCLTERIIKIAKDQHTDIDNFRLFAEEILLDWPQLREEEGFGASLRRAYRVISAELEW